MPVTTHSGYYNPGSSANYGDPIAGDISSLFPPKASTTPYASGSVLDSASQGSTFNLTNSPNVQGISDLVNSINRSAQQAAQAARIPQGTALETKSSTNIGQELSGQLPSDVVSLLQQQAAERGVATGLGTDSGNNNAAYLRALGLTSLQEQQTGQQNLSAAYARNPIAPTYDPGNLVMTPAQTASLTLQGQSLANQQINEQNRLAALRNQGGQSQGGRYGAPSTDYTGTSTGNSGAPTGPTGGMLFAPDVSDPSAGWGRTWSRTDNGPFQTGVAPDYGTGYSPYSTDIVPPDSNSSWQTGMPTTDPGYAPYGSGDFGYM